MLVRLAARSAATLALLLAFPALAREAALPPPAASGKSACKIEVGASDRVAQDANLVVSGGDHLDNAVAIRGDVVVKRGAKVRQAVAVGGSVVVEEGADIAEDAVALGGDVRVARGARVGKDAIALGGQVRAPEGATIGGSRVGLAIEAGGSSLAAKILEGIHAEGPCDVAVEASRR